MFLKAELRLKIRRENNRKVFSTGSFCHLHVPENTILESPCAAKYRRVRVNSAGKHPVPSS